MHKIKRHLSLGGAVEEEKPPSSGWREMSFDFTLKYGRNYQLVPLPVSCSHSASDVTGSHLEVPCAGSVLSDTHCQPGLGPSQSKLSSSIPTSLPLSLQGQKEKKQQLSPPCKLQKHEESIKPMLSPTAIRATPGVKEFVI